MNYTQAQIDRANAVSLEDFLRTQGETLIKSGREYRWKEHDSLTVRGNKWFRHSQSKGGYPIDFVMEFYGKSFPEAVQLLTGESAEGQSEASTAPPTAFHLPLHNRTADRAIQYLGYDQNRINIIKNFQGSDAEIRRASADVSGTVLIIHSQINDNVVTTRVRYRFYVDGVFARKKTDTAPQALCPVRS